MGMTNIILAGIFMVLAVLLSAMLFIFRVPKESLFRYWVETAFSAVLIAVLIKFFVIQAFIIPSSSMEDTLMIGDRIIAAKFIYGISLPGKDTKILQFQHPKRGEVVLFKYPEDPKLTFVKRCMGVPGDVILVRDKALYINGNLAVEPYIFHKDKRILGAKQSMRDFYGPVSVPQGNYFMMGDNRDMSDDSRFWGFVPEKYLQGKAWLVYWPPKRWKVVRHYEIKSSKR